MVSPRIQFDTLSFQANISKETLFCIFYQMPHDIMQELAAQELTARDWRWHKVLRQWLQKDTREANTNSSMPIIDLSNGAPIAVQPVRVSEHPSSGERDLDHVAQVQGLHLEAHGADLGARQK